MDMQPGKVQNLVVIGSVAASDMQPGPYQKVNIVNEAGTPILDLGGPTPIYYDSTYQSLYGPYANASAAAYNAIAIGYGAVIDTPGAVGIGYGVETASYAQYSVAIGYDSESNGESGVAIGYDAYVASGSYEGIAIGKGAQCLNVFYYGNIAIGSGAGTGPYDDNVAIGRGSYATAGAMAIGHNADARAANSIALGNNLYLTDANAVKIGVAATSFLQFDDWTPALGATTPTYYFIVEFNAGRYKIPLEPV